MERLKAAVADSSVILKWFRTDEPDADVAQQLRQAYVEERLELILPDLALYEVANVLRHRLTESLAIRALESLFGLKIPIYRVEQEVLRQALRLAFQHHVTVYDAAFLSAAKALHAQLLTADRRFYHAVRGHLGVFFLADLKVS